MITALAGGVGAARFLRGLVRVVPPAEVTAVVNVADDEIFHGLPVSPDLDTVTYTLAGAEGDQGWGLADETYAFMHALDRYGLSTWFRLGDRDLATHLYRAERLRAGATLSETTAEIAAAWGVATRILPVTDDRVTTHLEVDTPTGPTVLRMQEWFVRDRTDPPVRRVWFEGIEHARPAPEVLAAIAHADIVLVCPSNPVISIGPILAVPGVRDALRARRDRVVGVSPIIAGTPVKGPADRLMAPLGIEVSCVGIARTFADVCGTVVIDTDDAHRAGEIETLGVRAVVAETLMTDARVAAALAERTLAAVA